MHICKHGPPWEFVRLRYHVRPGIILLSSLWGPRNAPWAHRRFTSDGRLYVYISIDMEMAAPSPHPYTPTQPNAAPRTVFGFGSVGAGADRVPFFTCVSLTYMCMSSDLEFLRNPRSMITWPECNSFSRFYEVVLDLAAYFSIVVFCESSSSVIFS